MHQTGKRSEEGFTLIELLVVIVILGILSAVVVFAVGGVTDRGDVAACKATAKTIETASESFRAKNTSYASSLGALSPDFVRLSPAPTGNTYTVNGKTITYTPATGAVTDNC